MEKSHLIVVVFAYQRFFPSIICFFSLLLCDRIPLVIGCLGSFWNVRSHLHIYHWQPFVLPEYRVTPIDVVCNLPGVSGRSSVLISVWSVRNTCNNFWARSASPLCFSTASRTPLIAKQHFQPNAVKYDLVAFDSFFHFEIFMYFCVCTFLFQLYKFGRSFWIFASNFQDIRKLRGDLCSSHTQRVVHSEQSKFVSLHTSQPYAISVNHSPVIWFLAYWCMLNTGSFSRLCFRRFWLPWDLTLFWCRLLNRPLTTLFLGATRPAGPAALLRQVASSLTIVYLMTSESLFFLYRSFIFNETSCFFLRNHSLLGCHRISWCN